MKKLFFVFLLLAVVLPGEVKPLQFNLNYWMVKPVSDQALLTTSSPTFAGLTLSGGTASTLAYLNSSKKFTSLANGSGYLLNDGSGGLSWAAVSLSGYLKADGTVPLTSNWAVGAFELSQATWKGVAVGAEYGGTGQTSYAVGDLLYAPTTTTIGKLADVAVGQVLTSGGVGVAPAWSGNPSVASLVLTGTGTLASTAGNATFTTALTAATGNEVAFTLNYTTNKATSGTDTGLVINQTDTASPGTSYLQEWYVGATQKAYLDNSGNLQIDGALYPTSSSFIIDGDSNRLRLQGLQGVLLQGNADRDSGSMFSISSGSGIEITDTDGSQAWVNIAAKVNQSGTAGYQVLKIDVTETATGDGSTGANRLITTQVGGVEKWGVDNRGGQIVGLTPDAIMQVGMIAMVDAGTDERYDINGAGGTLPIGVVSGSGPTAVGTARGLIVQGTCYVAPAEDVVAVTRGHVCFVDGSDAGYVDDNAALQAAGLNIGRYINTEAAIAFNGADDVDPDTDQIVLDSTPSWVVGDPVIFWDSGDTAPTGMTTGAVYWIKTISTATVTLSATRGGATLDITADGSGTTMYLMRLPKVILHWQ